jgi:hypothetical protein
MNRSSLLALGLLLFSAPCFAQLAPSDSQTLQALLSEVRQMRYVKQVEDFVNNTENPATQRKAFENRLTCRSSDLMRGQHRGDSIPKAGAVANGGKNVTALSEFVPGFDQH